MLCDRFDSYLDVPSAASNIIAYAYDATHSYDMAVTLYDGWLGELETMMQAHEDDIITRVGHLRGHLPGSLDEIWDAGTIRGYELELDAIGDDEALMEMYPETWEIWIDFCEYTSARQAWQELYEMKTAWVKKERRGIPYDYS